MDWIHSHSTFVVVVQEFVNDLSDQLSAYCRSEYCTVLRLCDRLFQSSTTREHFQIACRRSAAFGTSRLRSADELASGFKKMCHCVVFVGTNLLCAYNRRICIDAAVD